MRSPETGLTMLVANQEHGPHSGRRGAAIALCGAIASIEPLEIPRLGHHPDAYDRRDRRGVRRNLSFVLPWSRLPAIAFNLGLVAMSALIAGLNAASGSADGAYHPLHIRSGTRPVLHARPLERRSARRDRDAAGRARPGGRPGRHAARSGLQVTLLLATLIVLCGLVLVMRATLDERALGIRGRGSARYRSVVLDPAQFDAALDAELSRARHERPLSVMALEVVGAVAEAEGRRHRGAVASVARTLVERIRIEDAVGHPGGPAIHARGAGDDVGVRP